MIVLNYTITNLKIDPDYIFLDLEDTSIKISLDKVSSKLKMASDFERNFYKISPSGYGIHWPLIDEDLSIAALLKFNELE
jgi:hypothetical protein